MIPLLLLLAMLGGALWSGVAALLKHWFNMSEFISTLMLNMIADFFTYWAINYPFFEDNANHPQTPLIAENGWMQEWGNFETLPTIAVPNLVLVGAEDVLTPPAEAEAMAAAIPGARLGAVPGAGHLANLEKPGAANAALQAFLETSR